MNILVAEDDPVSRLRLERTLRAWGHEVRAVEDGVRAWELLRELDAPTLAILDWMMPGMDGLEVVRKVGDSDSTAPLYIIMLTGQDGHEDLILGLESGADEYIIKPFRPEELRARIRVGERVLRLQDALSRRISELETALQARKRAEEALMEERHLLHALLDNVPDAIYFKDAASRFTRINHGQAKWLGLSEPEEAEGKTDFDFFASVHAQAAYADEQEIIRSGIPLIDKEEKETRPDGRETWVTTTKMPLRGRDGRIIGTIGVSRDITARKKAEETLQRSEEQVRLLLNSTAEAIYSIDLNGRCTLCNPASLRLLGYSRPEDFLGKDMHSLIHHTRADGTPYPVEECKIYRAFTEGKASHCDDEIFWRADGASFPAEYWSHPIQREDQVVGAVVAFLDITDRRRGEELLRRSQERARLLFTTIPHPIWVYDLKTLEFIEVNDAAVARYGYSRDEFLRMKITAIRPEAEIKRLVDDVTSGRPPKQASGEWVHRTKDGRIIDVEINSHTIDFAGRKAALVVAQDVTDKKKLEVDLRHAQKLEAVGGLAAGIAHEINTPIQFIGDNVRFLQDGLAALQALLGQYQQFRQDMSPIASPEIIEGLKQAEEAADLSYMTEEIPKALAQTLDGVNRVATIVRAMKDFAHPDQNQKAAADLNKALESTLVVARNELKYVAEVETDFGDLPPVICHLGDLNQVFLNLLVNAAHAIADVMKVTGKKGKIRVETRHEDDAVLIAISDTGSGVPEEIRNKIFDPFFTTKDVGKGTGQGLAIARSIVVDKHGGTLTFESEVGQGTTFQIQLPVESVLA